MCHIGVTPPLPHKVRFYAPLPTLRHAVQFLQYMPQLFRVLVHAFVPGVASHPRGLTTLCCVPAFPDLHFWVTLPFVFFFAMPITSLLSFCIDQKNKTSAIAKKIMRILAYQYIISVKKLSNTL